MDSGRLFNLIRLLIAASGAYFAWQNQMKIIDLLERLVAKPVIIIHVKPGERPTAKTPTAMYHGTCGLYRYRESSSGACKDARNK